MERYRPRIFYVYALFRPDTGIVCYIGKGKGYRLSGQMINPGNIRLKRIVAKCGKSLIGVKIRNGLTEAEALKIEIALIAAIGRRCDGGPLVNMSTGGESSASGSYREEPWVFTPEWRQNLSIAAKKRKRPPTYPQEHREAIRQGILKHWASLSSEERSVRTEPGRMQSLISRTKKGG